MATHSLDTLGQKCPQPVLKLAAMARNIPPGDTVEMLADCESFPKDVEVWCARTGQTLLFCIDDGSGKHTAQIQF